jgi:hypothetical protein
MSESSSEETSKTRLSISKATSLADINRTYFYQKFINPGLITVHTDERNRKYIELGELLRVT